jgi:hypothetical protein
MTFLLILRSSLAGGLAAVLLAGTVLAMQASLMDRALPRLVSFSTGTSLGAALLGLTLLDFLLVVAGIGVIALVAHGH